MIIMEKISMETGLRKWLVPVGIAVIMLLVGLSACSQSPSAPAQVAVDDSFNGKEVKIAASSSLQISLDSNPTTGFKWELTGISNTGILEKVSNTFETPQVKLKDGSPPVVGAGGKEFWDFKALKKGAATISMDYSQPWTGGQKSAKKFTLMVVVE